MSGGYVKLANRKFSSIPNEFCISFDAHAQIEEVKESAEEPLIETGSYLNLTSLREIADERF